MDFILSRRFCVYIDWTYEEVPRPFYVGKGTQKRVNAVNRNRMHRYIREKHGMERRIVFETDDEAAAFETERRLIEEHDTFKGWGANFTAGGEGTSGHHHTPEFRAKLSQLAKMRWADTVTRQSLINANLARWTPERRQRHAKAASQRWSDPIQRQSASEAAKHRWSDPAQLEAKSQSTKRLWDDPAYREKFSKPRTCKKCGKTGHYAKTCGPGA